MRAYAKILAPDDTEWLLGPGDRIGRLASAALTIDDARVSEAHAMISLRGGELRLLGLRGLFVVDGPPVQEVTLREGLEVQLAPGVSLEVLEIELPDAVLALQSDELPRQVPPSRRPACAPPRGRVAAELVAIVRRATAGDPAQRYADVGAFAADLQAYVDGRVVGAYRYSAWDQVRRPGWS